MMTRLSSPRSFRRCRNLITYASHHRAKLAGMEYPPSGSPSPCFHNNRIRTRVIGSPARNRFSSRSGVQSGRERTPRNRRRRGSRPFFTGGLWIIFMSAWLSEVRVQLPRTVLVHHHPLAKQQFYLVLHESKFTPAFTADARKLYVPLLPAFPNYKDQLSWSLCACSPGTSERTGTGSALHGNRNTGSIGES